MSNSKKIASIAFTGTAATAMTLMTANPALAASSWHVRNNGLNYKGVLKATNKAGTSPSFKDVTTGLTIKCKVGIASGNISKSKSAAASPKLGVLKKIVTEWKMCRAGALFNIDALSMTTSAALIAKTFSAGTHTMTGKLSGDKISVFLSGSGRSPCVVSFSGTSVPLKYMNTPHSFSINPARVATLKIKAGGLHCFGQLNVGDRVYFHGTYHVSTPIALTFTRSNS